MLDSSDAVSLASRLGLSGPVEIDDVQRRQRPADDGRFHRGDDGVGRSEVAVRGPDESWPFAVGRLLRDGRVERQRVRRQDFSRQELRGLRVVRAQLAAVHVEADEAHDGQQACSSGAGQRPEMGGHQGSRGYLTPFGSPRLPAWKYVLDLRLQLVDAQLRAAPPAFGLHHEHFLRLIEQPPVLAVQVRRVLRRRRTPGRRPVTTR